MKLLLLLRIIPMRVDLVVVVVVMIVMLLVLLVSLEIMLTFSH